MTKLRLVCATAALAVMAGGTAMAEVTANIGLQSDYIFRGVYQNGASAFAGLDIELDHGIYFGMWGTDLDDGLEYDIYGGYAHDGDNFDWYAGVTGYYYTDEFDDSYEEINLGFTYGFLTVDYALGDYKIGDPMFLGEAQTYTYVGATFSPEKGPYYFLGRTDYKNVDRDIEGLPAGSGRWPGTGSNGYWVEIGKSFELMEDLEISIAALYSGSVPQGLTNTPSSVQLGPSCSDFDYVSDDSCTSHEAEYALVLTLTKTIRTSY